MKNDKPFFQSSKTIFFILNISKEERSISVETNEDETPQFVIEEWSRRINFVLSGNFHAGDVNSDSKEHQSIMDDNLLSHLTSSYNNSSTKICSVSRINWSSFAI